MAENRSRGGSWAEGYGRARTTYRELLDASTHDPYTGFRCARDEEARDDAAGDAATEAAATP